MKMALLAVLFVGLDGLAAGAQEQPGEAPAAPAVRFEAVDVHIEAGAETLAAYQFEFSAETGDIKIVGIEGGEHPAFANPPYYDPAALSKDRIIIAAFSTSKELPRGRTRVARVHLQITGDAEPEYVVKVTAAATSTGEEIAATGTIAQGEGE